MPSKTIDHWVTRKNGDTSFIRNTPAARLAAVHAIRPGLIRKFSHQQHFVLSANKKKGRPQLGLPAVYGTWGRSQINANRRLNTKEYRMYQLEHRTGFGGTGLDEMVSTETVASIVERMNAAGRSRKDIEDVVGLLSKEREEVRYLLWTTDDPERPLSGHPGGLSKRQTDMRYGLTGSHGDKNNLRANWVLNQYTSGTGSEAEQLEDTSIMAGLMTNQLFSEPFAQLNTVSPTSAAHLAYHPVHGSIYSLVHGSITKNDRFRRAALNTHNARERRKWRYAERLMNRGYSNLVHADIRQWIEKGQSWAAGMDLYMKSVSGEKYTDSGPARSTGYIPQKDHTVISLGQWNSATRLGTMPLAIGAPRPLIRQATPYSSQGQRRYKQKLITSYFKHHR